MPVVAIQPVVESLDTVPEPFRAAYEERDGKFVLAKPIEIDDAAEVKGALAKERESAREATRIAKEREAELAKMRAEQEAAAAGVTSDKLREIEAAIETRLKAQYEPELEKARTSEQRARRNALKAAVASEVVDPDDFVTLLGDRFDFTDDGVPMPKGGDPKGMSAFLGTLRTEKPHLFRGTMAAGGGAAGAGSAGAARAGSRPVSEWTADEKMEYAKAHGQDALVRLAAGDGRKKAAAATQQLSATGAIRAA